MAQTTENSLMKRTKAELVKIILRKDDTEKTISEKIVALTKEIAEKEALISDYKDDMDFIVPRNVELANANRTLGAIGAIGWFLVILLAIVLLAG